MGIIIKSVSAVVVIAFAVLTVNFLLENESKLELKRLEVKSLNANLKELNVKYDKLNRELNEVEAEKESTLEEILKEKQHLESEKSRLEAELQAKKESKLDEATENLANAVTNTQVASASSGSVEQIIIDAANRYGVDANYALQIAQCESSMNPSATNYGYSENGVDFPAGIYQHLTNYWDARAAKYGYAGASVYDPVANANVTMAMWSEGLKYLWEC